jgi:hypothetical protein
MKRKSLSILFSLLAAILLLGCEKMPDPPGIYFGYYGTATECLEIAPNHVYRQVLIKDGKVLYDNTGSWSVRSDGNWGIDFENFIVATGMWPNSMARGTSSDTPPLSLENYTGVTATSDWDYVKREKVVLIRGDVIFLVTDKKSGILNAQQFVEKNQLPGR